LCKAKLSYDTLLRLAVVAMTPFMLIKTILGIADVDLPFGKLISLVVTLGYLYFAVKANCEKLPVTEEVEEAESFPQ
jgi:hypothetical protein